MPQNQLGGIAADGIAARTRTSSTANSNDVYTTPTNYTSVSALDARLAAIDGTVYTSGVLNKMTVNDKIYAVRLADDLGTV